MLHRNLAAEPGESCEKLAQLPHTAFFTDSFASFGIVAAYCAWQPESTSGSDADDGGRTG